MPNEIVRQIEGVQLLVIDALRHKPHPTHLSVAQALEVAERVRPIVREKRGITISGFLGPNPRSARIPYRHCF